MNEDIVHVQECRFFEADIDEGSLHSGKDPGHTAFVDISDDSFSRSALNEQFLDFAVLRQRDSRFGQRSIDNQFCGHELLL